MMIQEGGDTQYVFDKNVQPACDQEASVPHVKEDEGLHYTCQHMIQQHKLQHKRELL